MHGSLAGAVWQILESKMSTGASKTKKEEESELYVAFVVGLRVGQCAER